MKWKMDAIADKLLEDAPVIAGISIAAFLTGKFVYHNLAAAGLFGPVRQAVHKAKSTKGRIGGAGP